MTETPRTGTAVDVAAAPVSVAGVRTEPDDDVADQWAQAAMTERLPRLRANAAEWQKTVGTVAGLFGAGSLLGADTTVRALSRQARDLFVGAAFAAFIAVAASIVLASLAAQPRIVDLPSDLDARRQAHAAAFACTRRRLRASRWSAGAALLALLVSFAVRWYG